MGYMSEIPPIGMIRSPLIILSDIPETGRQCFFPAHESLHLNNGENRDIPAHMR
jgi:hypothetical protein